MSIEIRAADGRLEREQAQDLRRSVLCGELHLHRDLVDDGLDSEPSVWLGVAWSGPKPVGTLRLRRDGEACVLELLAVLPQQRRQHVARRLVEAALQQPLLQGVQALNAVGPAAASVFFEAMGFEVQATQTGLTVWQKALS